MLPAAPAGPDATPEPRTSRDARAPGALRRFPRELLAALPALLFLVASVSADMVAMTGHDPFGIWQVLPAGPVSGSWIKAELSSTALLLVAIGLARAKRAAWLLALIVLAAAVFVQGALQNHPGAAVIAILTGAILVVTRGRYVVRTGPTELRLAGMLLGLAVVVIVVDAASVRELAPQQLAWLVGTWLDAGPVGRLPLASGAELLLVARVCFLAAEVLALGPGANPLSAAERRAARQALRRLGRGSLLPYQVGSLAEPLASADGGGVLAYARAGRTAVALGDPVGPSAIAAFDVWLEQCHLQDWQPAVYQASEPFRAKLAGRGWTAVRVGAEAILRPSAFDLASPRLANVRHTVTRARRGGLRAIASRDGATPPDAQVDRLAELDAEWRRRNGPSLGFTVGEFDPSTLAGALVVAALARDGRVEAFVVLRPTGADGGWMLDLMRRRPGGVPGAVELCLVEAIESLRLRGVERLSLGLAPLAGLSAAHGPAAERLLAAAASIVRPLYDVRGLAFFKDKLAPSWEPRYLVVPSVTRLPGAGMALLWLHLGGSWGRVFRSVTEPLSRLGRTPSRLSPA